MIQAQNESASVNQIEVEALGRLWQERLRLQDWDITVRLTRASEFADKSTAGECDVFLSKQCALIRVQDPIDWHELPKNQACHGWDVEYTIVHEMLHVHMRESEPDGDDHDSPVWRAHERAIHRISEALLKAYRQ